MAEVKSAQITISEHWADHVHHKTVGKAPRWDPELGVVCACGEVLGWPDPEHKETLSQYTKRVASERVDQASAPGRVKGAFGTYGGEQAADPDPAPARGDDTDPVAAPAWHDDDPGPAEPDDAEVDWGEPPADEPEPEPLVIEPEEEPDYVDPAIAEARRATGVHAVTDVALPADEAQAGPWGSETAPIEPPPWEGVDDTHAVGDTVEVAGTTFTKVSDDPFPPPPENPSNDGIGRDVVPYAGTPIMPTAAQELDPLTGRLAPLDPTLPYTPADVELKIVEILRQLENSELFLRQQLARLHQATHNHDFRYNLALAKSDQRAQDQRKAEAWLATEQERREMTEADMLVRALRDSQHNLRAQLSGFQSVARSLAVSMVNALDGRQSGPSRPPLPPEPPRYN